MDTSLWSLFVSAFVSSTVLPGGSEAVLAYLATDNAYSPLLLISIAGIGNTLGGMTSWLIGRIVAIKYSTQDLLKAKHQVAIKRIQKWGSPLLLFSWLPVLGDPLCVAAGWVRIHWFYSLCFIAAGKFARYAIIVWAVN